MDERVFKSSEEALEVVRYLFDWSTNFNYPSPASLYVDLLGISDEQYGGPILSNDDKYSTLINKLGYLELGMLGEALIAYSEFPYEVKDWVVAHENVESDEA